MASQGIQRNLEAIIALCENPHWTASRKYRIAEMARESLSDIKALKQMPANRTFAELDDEYEPGNTDD